MSNQHQHGHDMERDRNKSGQHTPGNYKNDPDRAREAGKKGGEHSHGGNRERE